MSPSCLTNVAVNYALFHVGEKENVAKWNEQSGYGVLPAGAKPVTKSERTPC